MSTKWGASAGSEEAVSNPRSQPGITAAQRFAWNVTAGRESVTIVTLNEIWWCGDAQLNTPSSPDIVPSSRGHDLPSAPAPFPCLAASQTHGYGATLRAAHQQGTHTPQLGPYRRHTDTIRNDN
ncbi:hypothetical protein E2C01_007840 [Portunus trituberculatus]|uniref:Uncharacterized protein n=1 Tax=Portunus trituberculatus TaxID=210409 RepID=A0A5B7CZ63_PORTR|nr:hypothetical protein [Portunus trituberculatus]